MEWMEIYEYVKSVLHPIAAYVKDIKVVVTTNQDQTFAITIPRIELLSSIKEE
jgi:hypothetical protein